MTEQITDEDGFLTTALTGDVLESITSKIIEGGEIFLNQCADPHLSLSEQPENLIKLSQLAQVMPPACAIPYTPTTQLEDLNSDGTKELVLHTQVAKCGGFGGAGPSHGGVSAVFYRDVTGERWQGSLIWPCTDGKCPYAGLVTNYTEPLVRPLDHRDAQGRTFMLVVGKFSGGDADHEFLSVWRWDDGGPTQILDLHQSNWCGNPIRWEITPEGILVPAVKKTDRCVSKLAVLYILQGDGSGIEEP